MKTYPIRVVSRSLDPAQKSLVTVVGMYQHHLSDADINLVQDLQDYKRKRVLDKQSVSGAVTWSPYQFSPTAVNSFTIPSFDVLFNGDIITIGGNLSNDLSTNLVVLPPPQGQIGLGALVYVVYLEFRYTSLQDTTSYYQNLTSNVSYFYPNGCRLAGNDGSNNPSMNALLTANPELSGQLSMDVTDPFETDTTTTRAVLQWAIRVQPVSLNYDFTQSRNGLQPTFDSTGIVEIANTVFASYNTGLPIYDPNFVFSPMSEVNGDSGIWRAGTGSSTNGIGALDGYSYAMPLAVVFQKNTGPYFFSSNPFGCAVSTGTGLGLLSSGLSGRYDRKFADNITEDEVVDTRTTVSLKDYDYANMVNEGFVDLITGKTKQAIGRGTNPPGSVGSQVTMTAITGNRSATSTNAYQLGSFDTLTLTTGSGPDNGSQYGIMNGFCADSRVYYTTVEVRSINFPSGWSNASFTLSWNSKAVVEYVQVRTLINGNPVYLMQGTVQITYPNSQAVNIVANLSHTPFDPGSQSLYVTLGLRYAMGVSFNLTKVPTRVFGGALSDSAAGISAPYFQVFGVSEYETQSTLGNFLSYNNQYSNKIFGTRTTMSLLRGTRPASDDSNPANVTSFSIPNPAGQPLLPTQMLVWDVTTGQSYTAKDISISGNLLNFSVKNSISSSASLGLYTVTVNPVTQAYTPITSYMIPRQTSTSTNFHIVSLSNSQNVNLALNMSEVSSTYMVASVLGAVTDTLTCTILCEYTAQVVYNASVKGVVSIEETVAFGNYYSGTSLSSIDNLRLDPRLKMVYVKNTPGVGNTIVFSVTGGSLRAISGDDVTKKIWVDIGNGCAASYSITSVEFTDGLVVIKTSDMVNLESTSFFMVASVMPAFADSSTQLTLSFLYNPYQGEGVIDRDYDVLYSEQKAIITTNGTGAAPLVGIKDVFPYNREFPVAASLPRLINWSDESLNNQPVTSYLESNNESKKNNNIEHTFEVPTFTNDFIQPVSGGKRKTLRLTAPALRGFSQVLPHVGFAIHPPAISSGSMYTRSTSSPINLFVDSIAGLDSHDGFSVDTPKRTIQAALATLPPLLLHPCTINLANNNNLYQVVQQSTDDINNVWQVANLGGDPSIRLTKYYAIGLLGYTVQDAGSLTFYGNGVTIDGSSTTFTDGYTAAFYVTKSRVVFNGVNFQGFVQGAVKGTNSDIEFVNCNFVNNVTAGSFDQGCNVEMSQGSINLKDGCLGMITADSQFTSSGVDLIYTSTGGEGPGYFYVSQYGSTLELKNHQDSDETNITSTTVIVKAGINSSVICDSSFHSIGLATVVANSILMHGPVPPGHVPFGTSDSGMTDDTSHVVTDINL